jgi:sulfatase maturation enzyme AslB (radical SAM superfamily)
MQNRHLEITTYIDCPNRCDYCPQETLLNAYKGKKSMDIEDLKLILSHTPQDVDIHFSGFSESFFHPHIIDFYKEIIKTHQLVVYTTAKGITDEQVEELKHIKFKQFVVHDRNSRQLPFPHERVVINGSNKISRGGNLWERPEKESGVCYNSPSFQQNVVLPNGDVYLCCMDYGLKHKLGNLYEQKFEELKRERDYEICHKCEKFI